jgi:hypothetical protein
MTPARAAIHFRAWNGNVRETWHDNSSRALNPGWMPVAPSLHSVAPPFSLDPYAGLHGHTDMRRGVEGYGQASDRAGLRTRCGLR